MQKPVIIIGGGLIGMLSARELALAGQAVILLEQVEPGRESSWAGGGILSPLYPWRYPESVTALAHWSQQHYPALCQRLADTSGTDPQWTPSGLLVLDTDERSAAEAWARQHAMNLQWLTPANLAARVNGFNPVLLAQLAGAIWLPDIAQLRNPRMVKSLQAELRSLGVTVQNQTRVTGLQLQEGRLTGLETSRGLVETEQAVVCGGAWSAGLLPDLKLPVEPVKGQMLMYQAEPDFLRQILLYQDHYLIPRRDGHILVGSTVERMGFDKTLTEPAREELLAVAAELLPALANLPVERHWAGLRPGSPEGVPFIGQHPYIKGVWVNTGHFRNGVVLGYASARLLADLLLQRPPILDPLPYALGRLVD
jgi:glycine oxidase